MFLDLPDPYPGPLVTSTDPDADPASNPFLFFSHKGVERTEIMVAKNFENKNFLAQNLILIVKHIFKILKLSLIKTLKNMKNIFVCILKVTEDFGTDPNPHPDPLVKRYESEDPHPDLYQNVTDLEHWQKLIKFF
jgi:hypothetical protein